MNQQQPQGNPLPPYNPNNIPQGNYPQGYNQQQGYGQQWNAAPNFNPQPIPNQPQPNNTKNSSGKKKKQKKSAKKGSGSIILYIILGIILMIGLAVAGAFLGYNTAISARQAEYTRQSRMAAAEQYQLALVDIEQGKYNNAKTRLDYVIEVDQSYPGAMETYQQVIMLLYPTASPTPAATPTPMITATPDTRGEEEMFRGIQQAMYSQNWEAAINQINALRDKNISYRGLEVDSMYYIALRYYGIQQINSGYLENGVYNITLAESFGPIDNNADSMRNAARAYLSGAGFWEIDWSKALDYYSNAAATLPNLYDRASMMTANQRFAEASFRVAEEYVARNDYCGAIAYYDQALPISGTESMQMTATAVYLVCYPPQPTEAPREDSYYYDDSANDDETEFYGDEDYNEEDFYYGG